MSKVPTNIEQLPVEVEEDIEYQETYRNPESGYSKNQFYGKEPYK